MPPSNNHHQHLAERTKRTKLESKQLIRRAAVLQDPLLSGVALHRELALCHRPLSPLESRVRANAAGFEERHVWEAPSTRETIGPFAWDGGLRSFVYGTHVGHRNNAVACATLLEEASSTRGGADEAVREEDDSVGDGIAPPPKLVGERLAVGLRSKITSISISPASSIALATEIGDFHPASVHILTLTPPYLHHPPTAAQTIIYRRQDEESIWSSAANPHLPPSTSAFAVGMSSQVVLYTVAQGGWSDDQVLRDGLHGDAFALDWLTPTAVAVGQRGGFVTLWDTRARGSALRLRHQANVTGIRCVGPHGVVACGIQDALAMYDLRMPRVGGGAGKSMAASAPVVRYRYRNRDRVAQGFDVSAGLGMVAAVDGEDVVRMYSLQSGVEITMKRERRGLIGIAEAASCLQFTEFGGKDILMANKGGRLVSYSW